VNEPPFILYLDTSAWLKLYIEEGGSELVKQTVIESEQICTHLIAYTELRSALARAERENRIELSQKVTIIEAMEKDWLRLNIVRPVETLIRRAGLLCDQFGLRGFDSIHLAAAEAINLQTIPQTTLFASFDRKLNKSAFALGMSILPLTFHG
jgi:predicted nucleic acid-binding protein